MVSMRLAILFLAALPLAAIDDPVRTDGGLLSGAAGAAPEVRVYKGIPFAAPPTGDLRWRPPQPAAKWEGVRQADRFSATCMQTPYAAGSPYSAAAQPVSEDCLYLNLWTAAKTASERRPVMVWIHGGALTRGSGSLPNYDGEEYARKGIVLVTVNYRLGAFGFLAHPELTKESDRGASGNYGFLDQVAALEWVERNIAAFGGDPRKVTIFGESAGSWSVCVLAASPLAKGLFRAAIGESGGQFQPLATLNQAEQAGASLAKKLGAESLRDLRAKPADEILKADPGRADPVVDGWLLPTDISAIYAEGRQNDVALLLGSNADEGTPFTPAQVPAQLFQKQLAVRFGPLAPEFEKVYPAASDAEARQSAAALIRDQTFGWQMRTWARLQTKTGKQRAWMYFFSRVPPTPAGARLGSYHAAEIGYVFHHVRATEPVDARLSDVMFSYWVNFGATGDPNGTALPKWPAYRPDEDQAMEFGEKIGMIPLPHKAALDLLDRFFKK
jgi:para-nitrobenzyl esterase